MGSEREREKNAKIYLFLKIKLEYILKKWRELAREGGRDYSP